MLRRVEVWDQADAPRSKTVAREDGGPIRPRDRLSETDVRAIASRFSAGVAKYKLAAEYGVSLSTMKRFLRKHRERGSR